VALVIGQLSRGGAEGQLAQVACRIDRRRFEPFVYCLSSQSEPIGTILRAAGVPLRIICGSSLQRIRTLAQHFESDRIDVIHSWLFLANAAAAIAQLRRPRRPLVTSARNRKLQGRVNQIANVLAFRRSRAIVVNSRDVGTYIERQYWAPRERIRVIFNGIDTARFHPAPAGRFEPGPIVTIGRLVEQKNQALFLDAAAELSREVAGLRFVVVGAGPLRADLQARASLLGIAEQVTFAGEVDAVENVLRGASLFWLTSRWEGMPNVVLEAMASGVPVIATDVGGAGELIRDAIDGFVVANGDRQAFVAHSRALLCEAEKWSRFATAARQRAEMFSMARMVDEMTALYAEVAQ
jgi:glycosyltransferase involved in cell wall biosynthesis